MKTFSLRRFLIFLSITIAGISTQKGFAQDWKFESQRDQISPRWYADTKTTLNNKPTLGLSGEGKEYVDGHWSKTVTVEAGQYYQFRTFFRTTKVEEPGRCIQGRVIWLDHADKQVGFTEYPVTSADKSPEGW